MSARDRLPAWRRYLRFWGPDVAADVDDELAFHLAMRVDEYVAAGLSEADARRAALQRLGDLDAARASCIALGRARERQTRQADWLGGLRADLRYALRSLRRAPGWTAVALLTIALGVGATTAVFSVADALLVRPLPYPGASRVFFARRTWYVDGRAIPGAVPAAIVPYWRANARTIEGVAFYGGPGAVPFVDGRDSSDVYAARVDGGFLAFAGAHPVLGRGFAPEELVEHGPGAVLLTEGIWRRRYGASPAVLGRRVVVRGVPRTIVGVVPASLTIPDFRNERAELLLPSPLTGGGHMLVRLKPGVTPAAATRELNAILDGAHVPDVRPIPGPMPLSLSRPQDWLPIRRPVLLLTGAVALLLLVACTNVAHLLLARGAARQREIAVRHALGASRGRLVRQLITESLVLALLGGALAAAVAWGALRLLEAVRPATLVALTYVSPDGGRLWFAAVIAVLVGLLVGPAAALRLARGNVGAALRGGASEVAGASRLRAALVVGEVAVSAVLLVGALLLVHAVTALRETRLGFDPRGLHDVKVWLPDEMPAAERRAFVERALARASAWPGVESATLASSTPGGSGGRGWRMIGALETPDRPATQPDVNASIALYEIAPDYFRAMRMPLLAGRGFEAGSAERHEAIVSRTLARQLAGGGNALGMRFRNAMPRLSGRGDEPWQTVVGIVPDAVGNLVEGAEVPGLYQALARDEGPGFVGNASLVLRLRDGARLDLRREVAAVAPPGAQVEITNVRESLDESMAEPRFTMRVLAAFALLGVLLAAVGLFGVVSYDVTRRTREIGVRMTLGATRGAIARLVVGDGLRLALLGLGLGLAGAALASRLVQSLLFGVPRLDLFAFGAGSGVLLLVAVAACLVPTLRATAVDPLLAIRSE